MSGHPSGLNPEQEEAVKTTQGRLLVLAGAGTGKTRVLTTRIAYLISNCGVSPTQILGLTFTNKAAAEMRHRMATLVDKNLAQQVTLSTFHSFCMKVLRAEISHLGFTNRFTLYTEGDIERLIKMIARDISGIEGELPSIAEGISIIQYARSRGLPPEQLRRTGKTWFDNLVRNIYERLLISFKAYNAVDFEQLLLLTVELFEQFPEVLDKYQEKYRYIMIDEYQDTNGVQFRLAELLSKKYGNLCVVGDDDQSIYGWRGAQIANILSFDRAKVIKLEQNYRSTKVILDAANSVIAKNSSRHPKRLWSGLQSEELIEVFHAPKEQDEAAAVVARLVKLRSSYQYRWSDIAILYRSNSLTRSIEQELLNCGWQDGDQWRRGVPYHINGGVAFYERREVKDLLAYLKVILNPLDEPSILRIINTPRRGIGETTLVKLTARSRSEGISLYSLLKEVKTGEEISPKIVQGISSFVATIEKAREIFAGQRLDEAMLWLIDSINYRQAVVEDVKSDKMRGFKWENVEELVSAMARYAEDHENATLEDFVSTLSLDERLIPKQEHRDDAVQLMTFHSSKGLEFKAVYLIGLEEGILPHEKSLAENGIEEERRLFYVALTRAQRHLTLSMSRLRLRVGRGFTPKPSPFLFEIPKELLKVTPWDRVN